MYSNFRYLILTAIISSSFLLTPNRAEAFDSSHNVGAGAGVPFGIFGFSYGFEMNFTDSFAIIPSVAAGTSILAGATSEVGARLLLGGKNNRIRFGISYWSGTNAIIQTGTDTYVSESGTTAGVNLRIQMGAQRSHCIDIHVLQRITPTNTEIENKYSAKLTGNTTGTLLGIGYVHRF